MSLRNDPVCPAMAHIRDLGKDDHVKEEMTVATDAATLVDGKGGAGDGQAEPQVGLQD